MLFWFFLAIFSPYIDFLMAILFIVFYFFASFPIIRECNSSINNPLGMERVEIDRHNHRLSF